MYMILFFIQSQTTTMDTISCIYSTAWLCGFFFSIQIRCTRIYAYIWCNKCVFKKTHVSFIHEVHLHVYTKLVNVCYVSGFSGELVRSPVAIDLKKRVEILIQPKRSAFKVFDEKFEPKSYVPVAADTIKSRAKRLSIPKVLHFVTFSSLLVYRFS